MVKRGPVRCCRRNRERYSMREADMRSLEDRRRRKRRKTPADSARVENKTYAAVHIWRPLRETPGCGCRTGAFASDEVDRLPCLRRGRYGIGSKPPIRRRSPPVIGSRRDLRSQSQSWGCNEVGTHEDVPVLSESLGQASIYDRRLPFRSQPVGLPLDAPGLSRHRDARTPPCSADAGKVRYRL